MADSSLIAQRYRRWRWQIFGVTWLSYFGYYFTRKAFAAAKIGLKDEAGFGFTNSELGTVDFAFTLAYMAGQFLNGPLADRLGPRRILAVGMAISVLSCLLSGLSTGLGVFIVLWTIQGFSQATGWSALVKNVGAWFSERERGRILGWWCTNYAIGGLVATPFAAAMMDGFGSWRAAYFAPALVLALIAGTFIRFQRNHPQEVGLPSIEEFHGEEEAVLRSGERPEEEPEGSWNVIRQVLTSRTIWILGTAYFCLKPARYMMLNWGPTFINEQFGTGATESALISASFELGGPLGVLFAGYVSDRVFASRRIPICVLMMALVGVALLLLVNVGSMGRGGVIAVLFLLGFGVFGPDSVISGTAAIDFGTKKGAATAAGFINGMGSFGQLLGGTWLPGYLADRFSWSVLFYGLAGFAFLAAALLAPLWNLTPAHSRLAEPGSTERTQGATRS